MRRRCGQWLMMMALVPLFAGCLPAGWSVNAPPPPTDQVIVYDPPSATPVVTPVVVTPPATHTAKPVVTPSPKPSVQPKPTLKCLTPTKGEVTRADQLVKITYGGNVVKYSKVAVDSRFSVIATNISDPLSGGQQYPGRNHGLPTSIIATWLYYRTGQGTTHAVEVINNWTMDGVTLKYGPRVREQAIRCATVSQPATPSAAPLPSPSPSTTTGQ